MTTHINAIAQATRNLAEISAKVAATTGDERDAAARAYDKAMENRLDLISAALRDGIDPGLMQWAIGINDSPAKVQMQRATAHATAAAALYDDSDDDADGM